MAENERPIERINSERKLTSLHDHEYYGPLIDSYTKSILTSGILLDEDLEVLLSVVNFKTFAGQDAYKPSLSLLTSVFSMVGSSLLAKRYDMPLLVILPALFVAKSVSTEFKKVRKKKNNREIIDTLIDVMNKIYKLNVSIIRYMKTRSDLGKAKNSSLVVLADKSIKEFLRFLLTNERNMFQLITGMLRKISLYSDELSDDHLCLMCLNPLGILEVDDAGNIETVLALVHNMQDLHVLFASKLLSYFGIVCCSETTTLCDKDLDKLLNEYFPNLIKRIDQHHDAIKKQFITLRNSVNKKSEYKLQAKAKTNNNRQLLTKLQETLVYSVNNLSIILEKSQNVLDKLDDAEEIDLKEVDSAIIDLRNHTFATYESLDLLCKLYGILSNFNASKQSESKVVNSLKTKDFEPKLPTVKYDDNTEPLEEKFELYIGNEDISDVCPTKIHEEDRSGEYLSLMLQELRQSLKQHERFIDARKRRGSEGDEGVSKDFCITLRKSPPKFNLDALKQEPSQIDIQVPPSILEKEKEKETITLNSPVPPPPPPPPSFNLRSLEEESGQINARSMLDNIKVLSGQRNVQEDVFGDSDVESSCSDD